MVLRATTALAAAPKHAAFAQRRHRAVRVSALFGLGAKKAAAVAAKSSAVLLPPDAAFAAATFAVVGLYAIALLAPLSKPGKLLFFDRPFLVPALLGAAYLVLAWQAHQTGAIASLISSARACLPAPEPSALAAIFRDRSLTAMAWLHLLAVDYLSASAVLRDGVATATPTRHSVALCLMFGPLGVLSHSITRAVVKFVRSRRQQGDARSPSPLV